MFAALKGVDSASFCFANNIIVLDLLPLLPVLGKFTATLSREENEIAEPVYVVKGQGDTALLSSGAAERMGLVEYHLDLTSKHTHASHGGNSSRDS